MERSRGRGGGPKVGPESDWANAAPLIAAGREMDKLILRGAAVIGWTPPPRSDRAIGPWYVIARRHPRPSRYESLRDCETLHWAFFYRNLSGEFWFYQTVSD